MANEDPRACYRCMTEVHSLATVCPQCGAYLTTSSQILRGLVVTAVCVLTFISVIGLYQLWDRHQRTVCVAMLDGGLRCT